MHSGQGEIGRAIVNLPAEELAKIRGKHSSEFEETLGYDIAAEACDRENIVIIVRAGFEPVDP